MNKHKQKTIHIISQAHLDLAWMWSWREAWSEALNNITTVVRLMDKYPQLTFSYSNAIIYKWMLESAPDLFEKVRTFVAEERWEIVGGWLVESDCNIPSGESLLRQALTGKRFFKKQFDVDVKTGYCPDAFGHCGELPKILNAAGMDHYVFSKPRYGEEFPHYFIWRASDGSEVSTWRIHGGYATGPNDTPESITQALRYAAKANFPPNCDDTAFFLGLGDHGGGPSEEQVKAVLKLDSDPDMPNIKFSTLANLFKALEKSVPRTELPVVSTELQRHNIGCYSANAAIKKMNRQTETALLTAETVATLSSLSGNGAYPRKKLEEAWEHLLFNQFHDIIAGTCVPRCYDEAAESLGAARQVAKEITTAEIHKMSRKVNTADIANNAVFAFNQLGFSRRVLLALDMFPAIDGNHGPSIASAVDPESGESLMIQFADADCPYGPWNMPWQKLLISVELPAFGYKTIALKSEQPTNKSTVPSPLVTFEADSANLAIQSIKCADGMEWLKDGGVSLVAYEDESDTFGHGVTSFLNDSERQAALTNSRRNESGPLRWREKLYGSIGDSKLRMSVNSYSDRAFMDLTISGDWREINSVLKLAVSSALDNPRVVYQTPYGSLERNANGEEVVGQAWCAVNGEKDGEPCSLVILNSGLHSFDAVGGTLHLTLRRSVQFTHYGEFQRRKEDKKYLDQGEFSETLRIIPMNGKLNKVAVEKLLQEYQFDPLALIDTAHEGNGEMQDSLLTLKSKNSTITALKQSDDDSSIEIRLLEHSGEKEGVKVNSPAFGIDGSIAIEPFQLKTTLLTLNTA